jgi:hypothetical protein
MNEGFLGAEIGGFCSVSSSCSSVGSVFSVCDFKMWLACLQD